MIIGKLFRLSTHGKDENSADIWPALCPSCCPPSRSQAQQGHLYKSLSDCTQDAIDMGSTSAGGKIAFHHCLFGTLHNSCIWEWPKLLRLKQLTAFQLGSQSFHHGKVPLRKNDDLSHSLNQSNQCSLTALYRSMVLCM